VLLGLRGRLRRCPVLRRRRACGRIGATARGKKPERIDVSLLVRGDSDAQVNVGGPELGLPGGTDDADRGAFLHARAAGHHERAQVDQGGGVPVARSDGEGEPAAGNRAGKRDRSAYGRDHRPADGGADVDAAMLTAGVRIAAVE
jgi:hypothetical protein